MRTATVVLRGDFRRIVRRYPEIFEWIAENGYEVAGPLIEVYLVTPDVESSPAGYRTEVHVPVRAN